MLYIGCIYFLLSGAPFDRVKMLHQIFYRGFPSDDEKNAFLNENQPKIPPGILACIKFIIQTQGILALWRGNLANCLRYVPKTAFDMAFKEELKDGEITCSKSKIVSH